MTPECVLIQRPDVDFDAFLGLSREALGYSPASGCDASARELTDAERFLSCLAALRTEKAEVSLAPALLNHVSFSAMIVADERDALDIFQAAGMPFVVVETVRRGILLAVMTGTLAQWRDAVMHGTVLDQEVNVRACYCKLMALFEQAGLGHVWDRYTRKASPDRLFYLEYK